MNAKRQRRHERRSAPSVRRPQTNVTATARLDSSMPGKRKLVLVCAKGAAEKMVREREQRLEQ